MKEHFVTLFDFGFLPQGLCLYRSLESNCTKFHLWILCLDHKVFSYLSSLNLPNVSLLDLTKLESSELKDIKQQRTRAEYCWTLTPWSIYWVFQDKPDIQRVTYVDADLFFLDSLEPIYQDFDQSACSVLLTKHNYSPEHDQSFERGIYCVQFLTFARGPGEVVLSWWKEKCIEWCFDRVENGKFGDQKYLEEFPKLFANDVHICTLDSAFLAPWNVSHYRYSEAICYHFHGLRVMPNHMIFASDYLLPVPVLNNIYRPYISLMFELAESRLIHLEPQIMHAPSWLFILMLKIRKKFVYWLSHQFTAPYYFWNKRSGCNLL